MSVMIKNLDMPIGCQKCKFFRKHMFGNGLDYSYSCILGAKEFPMPWIRQLDNRAVDCPITEADKAESKIHCIYTDEEIAKSFIEDVESVKDLLPMAESEERNGIYRR